MNTQTYKPVTTGQIKKIHVLLQQKGLMEEKETIINSVSDGRTQSTKELTCYEATRLISFLLDENAEIKRKMGKVVNAIWDLAWNMEIIYGKTKDDFEMNIAKLNMFCRQRGAVKKNITVMNLMELQKIHRQFEAMYSKYKQKNSNIATQMKFHFENNSFMNRSIYIFFLEIGSVR